MSVTITKADADGYFDPRNHIQSAVWLGFSDNQRTAAVEHSKRLITRAIGSDITGETTDTASNYYPAWATYEQALYGLVNSEAIANGEQNAPRHIASTGRDAPRTAQRPLICEEAKRWLCWGNGSSVTIARG